MSIPSAGLEPTACRLEGTVLRGPKTPFHPMISRVLLRGGEFCNREHTVQSKCVFPDSCACAWEFPGTKKPRLVGRGGESGVTLALLPLLLILVAEGGQVAVGDLFRSELFDQPISIRKGRTDHHSAHQCPRVRVARLEQVPAIVLFQDKAVIGPADAARVVEDRGRYFNSRLFVSRVSLALDTSNILLAIFIARLFHDFPCKFFFRTRQPRPLAARPMRCRSRWGRA